MSRISRLLYLTGLLCLLFYNHGFSQCNLKGNLVDSTGSAAPYIPVGLLNAADSSVYRGVITDIDGNYCFGKINKGTYLVKISAVGFNTIYSGRILFDSTSVLEIPLLTLNSRGINLNEVSVTTMKKTVEFKNGNITMNIEGTALAMGNSAYDLLTRLPGVSVADDNISIQGRTGVRIMIDGKIQQLSGQQLINLLKSINASQIEKIEVLKKPPVKYDAAGTGGMINIKTKKAKIVGFSGNVYSSFSQGFYGNPSTGFTLNYKGKKINFFSGFTATREWIRKENTFQNKVTYDSLTTTMFQRYVQKQHNHYETYNLGADWFINKNNSVGVKVSGAFGMGNEDRVASTTVSDNSLGYRTLQYNFQKPNPWIYPDFNLNAEHLFDTSGTTLRFSADYSPYYDLYKAGFNNHFLDQNSNEVTSPTAFRTANTLNFSILSSKLDFEKQFKKSLKLEAGLKAAYQDMLSDYVFENLNTASGLYETDNTYTNLFSYKEQISAAYFNLSKEYKKINVQLGLRGENTIIHAESKSNSIKYTRQYFNLFPVLSFEYKRSENHNFQISYNKRINRPDYNSFNPYRTFKNVLNAQQGNPYLYPEYISSVDLTYSYKSIMYHTLSYSRIDNVMMDYTTQNDTTKFRLDHTANLKKADIYSYALYIQKEVTKWWTLNVNANVYAIKGNGIINEQPYYISTLGFNPGIFTRFALPKGIKFELNSYYFAPVLEGVNHVKARSSVDLALKKMFLKDKLSVSLSANDIFFKRVFNSSANYQNVSNVGTFRSDTRRFNISLNYNFGKLKVQQREIKSNNDEKGRVSH